MASKQISLPSVRHFVDYYASTFNVEPTFCERDTDVTLSVSVCACICVCELCLDLAGPELLYLCMDFKIVWHSRSP